jgi:hypothetical protein
VLSCWGGLFLLALCGWLTDRVLSCSLLVSFFVVKFVCGVVSGLWLRCDLIASDVSGYVIENELRLVLGKVWSSVWESGGEKWGGVSSFPF